MNPETSSFDLAGFQVLKLIIFILATVKNRIKFIIFLVTLKLEAN